jgi:hypothetical protein
MNLFQSEFFFRHLLKIGFVFASLFTYLISLQAPFANSLQARLFANAQATFLQTPRQAYCKRPGNLFANTQAAFLQTPRQPFCKRPGNLFANAQATFLKT